MEFKNLEEPENISINECQQTETVEPKPKFKSDSGIFNFLLAFSLFFLLSTYIFNIFIIPIKVVGLSMQPTINQSVTSDQDDLHCDIVYYRKNQSYNHGDVVIAANKNDEYFDSDGDIYLVIKRVIACGGDTIKFIPENNFPAYIPNSKMYYSIEVTNSEGKIILTDEDYIKEEMYYENNDFYHSSYLTTFPVFTSIYRAIQSGQEFSITVPDNSYFLMGDNRNNSSDSRVFGCVEYEDILGSVRLQVDYGETVYEALIQKITK